MKLTKSYIVEKVSNKYRVRIPIYHGIEGSAGSTETSNLPLATVCSLKGSSNIYTSGDVVYVFFEDNDLGKPVILGSLVASEKSKTNIDLDIDKLLVSGKATLPEDTTIGTVSPQEIKALDGVRGGIQSQIDNILNCVSTYNAEYIEQDFAYKESGETINWILEDKGLSINSKLLDEDSNEINTYDASRAQSKVGNSIIATTDTGTDLYESDGHQWDKQHRLNWLGVNTIQNDQVKMSMGLYARNHWKLYAKQSGSVNLAEPEYTFRPTIQSYTSNEKLKVASMLSDDASSKKIKTALYPYHLNLNPDGGSIFMGRGGAVTIYDEDVDSTDSWYEQQDGKKQGIQIGNMFLYADTSGKFKQFDTSTGVSKDIGSGSGSGSAANFFVFTINWLNYSADNSIPTDGTNAIETINNYITLDGIIYRISLDGTHLYTNDNTITYDTEEVTDRGSNNWLTNKTDDYTPSDYKALKVTIGNKVWYILRKTYITPSVNYGRDTSTNALLQDEARVLSIENLYAQYTTDGVIDIAKMYSGYIELNLSLQMLIVRRTGYSLSSSNTFTINGITYTYNSSNNCISYTMNGTSKTVYANSNNLIHFEGTAEFGTTTYYYDVTNKAVWVYAGILPITATSKVQLGTLLAMNRLNAIVTSTGETQISHQPVIIDLSSQLGLPIAVTNQDMHFFLSLDIETPNIVETNGNATAISSEEDIISISMLNCNNYMVVLDLETANVLSVYASTLSDNSGNPAPINVDINYVGVDIDGVSQSEILKLNTNDTTESI